MKRKQMLAFGLTTAMAASLLAGCGGEKKDKEKEEGGIKEFTAFFAVPGTEINDDNEIQEKIAEITGAKCKETWLTGQTAEEAVGTMIAGGEYPDFIDGGDAMEQLYEAGALVPLDDYIDDYPNIKEYYTEEEWDKLRKDDGHIYWIQQFGNIYGEEKATTHNDEAFWIQARVLEWAGYCVSREFYVNDAGNQIEKFATSLEVRYLQLFKEGIELPEDAYKGADIIEHAKNFAAEYGDKYVEAGSQDRRDALVAYALPKNISGLENDLMKYRIKYDNWFRESTLHNNGAVDRIINRFKELGVTYEQDGALWFKASEFGNDKDIVLVRANGIPTYIVPDIAYHYDKLVTRGFDKAVDVLGADHHGYVPRMKAALSALGIDTDRLDCVIMQMVRLVRDGETIKLSKRSGKAITLNTLLDEVPIDAARFFFNLREPNSHFDFDLDLAAQETSQNPVYYVQYAHARICSILKKAKADGIELREPTDKELDMLNSEEERELIRHLSSLTDEIVAAAKAYDPAKITHFVIELATLFHKFYNAHRVIADDEGLMQARLSLCLAVKETIRNVLEMLKISAPETM